MIGASNALMHSAAGTRFAVTIKLRICQNVVISVEANDFAELILGTSALIGHRPKRSAWLSESIKARIHTFIHKA